MRQPRIYSRFRPGPHRLRGSIRLGTAVAKLVDGVVLDDQEVKLLTPDEAAEYARTHLRSVGKDPPSGTRPADIKRHLKALLKLRPDLALVGRLLVIRPVRHLIRGAYLDRGGDKYSLGLARHINPLYAPAGSLFGDGIGGSHLKTWQPHFQPLLIDLLAEGVFDRVGSVTTLEDFVAWRFNQTSVLGSDAYFLAAQVVTLVLAGERDRAAAIAEEVERGVGYSRDARDLVSRRWDQVSKDIESVCAEFHAKEAAVAKALKIEHIWEPSPFPVELPAAERASRTAEPPLSTTPWVSRPSWLLGEMPEQPGEVRFGKSFLMRGGREMLLGPLTREEAEQRHSAREDYALAARLTDGVLLLITYEGWDRNDPAVLKYRPDYRPIFELHIWLYGPSQVASASTSSYRVEGMIHLWSMHAHRRHPHESLWHCYLDDEKGAWSVSDYRTGERVDTDPPFTLVDRELVRWPPPAFCEYADIADRFRALLRSVGYGEVL